MREYIFPFVMGLLGTLVVVAFGLAFKATYELGISEGIHRERRKK